jgi:hypothetical protein
MAPDEDTKRCPSCGTEWPAGVVACPACGREDDAHLRHHPSYIPGGTLPWQLPLAMKLFVGALLVWIVLTVALLMHRWY